MKKVYGYFGMLLLMAMLLSTGMVFAQESDTRTNFDALAENFGQSADGFFSEVNWTANSTRLLLGLLLWMILYSIFKPMNLFNKKALWSGIVSLIVTLLTFIYLPVDLLNAISYEYAAIGGTILTVIPFAIAVYFTVWVTSSFRIARIIWLIFGLYYAGLLIITYLRYLSSPEGGFFESQLGAWYYVLAFIASALLFWFIAPLRETVWKEHVKSVDEKISKKIDNFGLGINAGEKVAKKLAEDE